jgi:hypothetical protein
VEKEQLLQEHIEQVCWARYEKGCLRRFGWREGQHVENSCWDCSQSDLQYLFVQSIKRLL